MKSRLMDDSHEIRGLLSFLRWMCLDQSNAGLAVVSWMVFLVFGVAVPSVSHFVLSYRPHRRPYDLVVHLSLSAAAALSFISLSTATRRGGLRRFIFLDKVAAESARVRAAYSTQLRRSFRFLAMFLASCFAAEVAYKIWWYAFSADRIPFWENPVATGCVACALELTSWVYRAASFLLACAVFRSVCHLHILRLQEFVAVFQEESEVLPVLKEHLRLRQQLKVISHRFRAFILSGMVMVTVSQFAAVLVTTRPHSDDNLFNTGELALCSIVLVAGLLTCLRSAAKITHKAQALTSHAAKWHVGATIQSYDIDPETACEAISISTPRLPAAEIDDYSDDDDDGGSEEDELEGTKIVPTYVRPHRFLSKETSSRDMLGE